MLNKTLFNFNVFSLHNIHFQPLPNSLDVVVVVVFLIMCGLLPKHFKDPRRVNSLLRLQCQTMGNGINGWIAGGGYCYVHGMGARLAGTYEENIKQREDKQT